MKAAEFITLSRIDGPPATFDPATILRATRGIISPTAGQRTPKTEVTIDDPEPVIHTDEDFEEILVKIGKNAPMIRLTAPDGSPIAVNAKKITDLRKPDPFDLGGVPGPIPVGALDAHAQFRLGEYRNFVKETVETVQALIETALAHAKLA